MTGRPNLNRELVAGGAGIAAGVFLAFNGGIAWWLNIVLVCLVLLVMQVRLAVSVALIAAHGIQIAAVVSHNVRVVPEWDFRVFWLHAQLAARGYDFYDRTLVHGFLSAMHASPRMVELGRFWNPPQAMVLLLPLGYIDNIHVAYALWYGVQILALAGCVVLLWREFVAPPIAIVGLVLALYPTLVAFVVGQTQFLLLFLLLASWRARRSAGGGVWLALAVVVKPIALLLLVEPLVRRGWRMLAGFVAAIAALTIASIALFGAGLNVRFLLHGAGDVPRPMLTQLPNRSLLASVLRAGLPEWVFVAAALLVVATLAIVVWRDREEWMSVAAIIAAALLVYPQTLDHYGVLLIVAIVALWQTSTAAAIAACAVHALAAPVPSLFEFPNVALASTIALAACAAVVWSRSRYVTSARARVANVTAP